MGPVCLTFPLSYHVEKPSITLEHIRITTKNIHVMFFTIRAKKFGGIFLRISAAENARTLIQKYRLSKILKYKTEVDKQTSKQTDR